MPTDPECEGGGYLVGMEFSIPPEPSVRYVGGRDFVGCNRVFCPTCQSWVRHVDRRQLGDRPTTRAAHEWLYENLQTAGPPSVVSDAAFGSDASRVYAGKCNTEDCGSLLRISSRENDWHCAGHPR